MEPFQNTRQPDWGWWAKLWPTPGATLREVGVEAGTTLAEVGSGNGYFALPAAKIADPAPVYAVDLDPAMLGELDRLADYHHVDNVDAIEGDARSLSHHLPEPVDRVLVANTLHGVDAMELLVEEVHESLADDGRLVVINWHALDREQTTIAGESRGPPTELRMTPGDTADAITAGDDFELDHQVDLPPYHYALVFRTD
jgi:precorrin-6B methylase 2